MKCENCTKKVSEASRGEEDALGRLEVGGEQRPALSRAIAGRFCDRSPRAAARNAEKWKSGGAGGFLSACFRCRETKRYL